MIAVSPPSSAQSACDAAGRDALDDLLQQRRIVVRHGHVVEEEQRLGPAAQGVVDAHRHQVDAHRVVHGPTSVATLSFVPTPSVQETSTGSS